MDAKLELGTAEKELERDVFDLTFLKKTTKTLLKKQNFSFIANTLFDFLKLDYDRGFVGVIKGGEIKYYRGFSKVEDNIIKLNDDPASLSFNVSDIKSFEKVISENSVLSGKIAKEDAEIIKSFIGGYQPPHCVILPFRVYDKTVAVLYCDNIADKSVTKNLDQIQILSNAASLAMQITVLNEKITVNSSL
jgi:hypothetical protein